MIKFKQFNELINPGNNQIYLPLHNKSPLQGISSKYTFDTIKGLGEKNLDLEIGLVLPKGFIVLNIDNKLDADLILKIIENRKEKVMVVGTPKGIHIYAKSGFQNNTINNVLAIGIRAGTISEDIGKSYVVTPFKSPHNTNPRLKSMKIVYFNGIEKLPCWLTPIHTSGSKSPRTVSFNTYPIEDENRFNAFMGQLTWIKFTRLNANERAETIKLINQYMTVTPMEEKQLELDLLFEFNDDQLPESVFFNKEKFLHHKLGDYLIDYTNAVKDQVTKLMYFYSERKNVYSNDYEYLKGIITNMIPSLTDNRKNEVIKHMESKLSLNPVLLDNKPYLVNFKNGVLDLEDLKFYNHSPSYHGTIQLNVNYNPNAYDETPEEFFQNVTMGDKDIEQLCYEAIGYSFLKTIGLDKTFILTGKGKNGKSTFLNVIREILGLENVVSLDFKELNSAFGTSGLAGKLASIAGDISNKRIDDSDIFKKIVSGDLIRINEKYKAKYDMVPFTTLFFSANDIPKSADTTYAYYRRLAIIPFHANLSSIKEVEGKNFQKKLFSEPSKEMIAYKSVLAIHKVLTETQQFIEPEAVKKELQKYRISNSSTLQWCRHMNYTIKDFCKDAVTNLYDNYKTWCDIYGRKHKNFDNFTEEIETEFELKYDHKTQRFDKV